MLTYKFKKVLRYGIQNFLNITPAIDWFSSCARAP